ncbi:MAG: hypothetical protein FWD33_02890 [Alphaproteobacteria bacterium]|nr:hypothetical protein [Alphaproteobacteria bacterium]
MTHEEVWEAIDLFAKSMGKTVSGLARHAGLDATTFNPSKRKTNVGQERWPTTLSIAKVLVATDSDIMDMIRIYRRHKMKSKDAS